MHNCLILGSGRSGTSMVAGTLAKAGYFMGDRLYSARDSNPLGFFEDPEINGINEELIAPFVPGGQKLVAPQRWLARLDRCVEPPLPPPLQRRVRALVARAPFCFKDPRFAYTLPAWRPELADTRFVCVFRDPAVTAASIVKECAAAEYLRGVEMTPALTLELWCATYGPILRRHRHQGDWLFVHYDQLLADESRGSGRERLAEFLRAPIDASFPSRALRRTRAADAASPAARRLYAELCELARFEPPAASSTPVAAARTTPVATARSTPDLSVLICTYNRKPILLECLESFSRQTLAPERYEIVVVVDGSEDGSAEAVRSFASRVPIRLIHRARNAGLSSARSAALAAARGEVVLLVNDDTIAFSDLLERHLAAHAARAGAPVAVLGTFEQPAEQLKTALMRLLEQSSYVFGYAGLRAGVDHDWTRFWGCNVSVSRQAALEAGAFDAVFRHYGCEDTDLGIRLFERGIPVRFEPAARAWHRHVLTFADVERRQKTVARAYVRFFARHPIALDHPDWKSTGEATLAQLEAGVAARAPELERCADAARQLSQLDCQELEAQGSQRAELARTVVERLDRLLQTLNRDWWAQGFADGMRELGLKGFRELRDWRRSDAPAWPIAADHPVKVLAWPRWDDEQELAELLAVAGDARLAAPPCLCLRHDPEVDGPIEEATRRLAAVGERVLRGGIDVDVVLLSEPMAPADWPRLGRAVTCALLLGSSDSTERSRFFTRARAPGVRGVEDLLAFVPTAPLSRPVGRVWSELSV